MPAITDINELLTHMQPILNPGRYAFVALLFGIALDLIHIVAYLWEPAGLSVILSEQIALDLGLPVALPAAWITLTIHPDLAAVGPTAAFSQALGRPESVAMLLASITTICSCRLSWRSRQWAHGMHCSDPLPNDSCMLKPLRGTA